MGGVDFSKGLARTPEFSVPLVGFLPTPDFFPVYKCIYSKVPPRQPVETYRIFYVLTRWQLCRRTIHRYYIHTIYADALIT